MALYGYGARFTWYAVQGSDKIHWLIDDDKIEQTKCREGKIILENGPNEMLLILYHASYKPWTILAKVRAGKKQDFFFPFSSLSLRVRKKQDFILSLPLTYITYCGQKRVRFCFFLFPHLRAMKENGKLAISQTRCGLIRFGLFSATCCFFVFFFFGWGSFLGDMSCEGYIMTNPSLNINLSMTNNRL